MRRAWQAATGRSSLRTERGPCISPTPMHIGSVAIYDVAPNRARAMYFTYVLGYHRTYVGGLE